MNRPPSHPLDQKPRVVTSIPGPRSVALRAREDKHIAPGLQGYAVMAGVVAESAEGSAIRDVDGNVLLDFIGGIGVGALGHSHPSVVEAIRDQVGKIAVGSLTSEARVELVERVAAHAPGGAPRGEKAPLHRLQLYSSGAEAVESALRLAKCATGKNEFVSCWGGFHGKTMGALSLMGSTFKEKLGPMVPGAHLVPYADCYRCPLKATYPSCGLACVELARKQLKMESAGAIAAFIVEPMQGTAGNVIPPDDYLPALHALAKEHDALLIVDEMITGFGRTGRYWGHEHSGVTPDIVTIGKAFGGGFPLSGLLTRDDIAGSQPWAAPSGSSSSYGGNALAAAAGAAAVRAIDDEGLVEHARVIGRGLLDDLVPMVDDYPFVGTVRGRGLFLSIELVASKSDKEPLAKRATERLFRECVKRGLLTMSYSPHFRLQPALTIDARTAKNGVAILREVFDLAKREGFWRG